MVEDDGFLVPLNTLFDILDARCSSRRHVTDVGMQISFRLFQNLHHPGVATPVAVIDNLVVRHLETLRPEGLDYAKEIVAGNRIAHRGSVISGSTTVDRRSSIVAKKESDGIPEALTPR